MEKEEEEEEDDDSNSNNNKSNNNNNSNNNMVWKNLWALQVLQYLSIISSVQLLPETASMQSQYVCLQKSAWEARHCYSCT